MQYFIINNWGEHELFFICGYENKIHHSKFWSDNFEVPLCRIFLNWRRISYILRNSSLKKVEWLVSPRPACVRTRRVPACCPCRWRWWTGRSRMRGDSYRDNLQSRSEEREYLQLLQYQKDLRWPQKLTGIGQSRRCNLAHWDKGQYPHGALFHVVPGAGCCKCFQQCRIAPKCPNSRSPSYPTLLEALAIPWDSVEQCSIWTLSLVPRGKVASSGPTYVCCKLCMSVILYWSL